MIANLLSAFTAFFLEVVLMGAGTVLGVDRSAARILGGSTSHRKGTLRKVVALLRAGGRCDEVFALASAPCPRRCFRRGYVNLARKHQNGHFCCFRPCDYKREKRGIATDSVIPLRDLPCLSCDCCFISRFFLVSRDPCGKIEKFTLWVQ